jgi:hypothetical protein
MSWASAFLNDGIFGPVVAEVGSGAVSQRSEICGFGISQCRRSCLAG